MGGGHSVEPHSHCRHPHPGSCCSASLQMGFHLCLVGWMDNGTAGYPTAFPTPSCGSNHVGIVDYGPRSNLSETWDAFCYREKGERCGHGAGPGGGDRAPRAVWGSVGSRGTARRIAAFPCRRDVRVPRRLRGGWHVVPRPPARRAGRGSAFLHLLLRKRRAGSGTVAGPARAARSADGMLSSCCSLLPTARRKGWSFSPICPTTPLPKHFLSP